LSPANLNNSSYFFQNTQAFSSKPNLLPLQWISQTKCGWACSDSK
jgi:hypothetical protein